MKRKIIIYFFIELCFIFLILLLNLREKKNQIDYNDVTTLNNDSLTLYDSELQEVGNIIIKKEGEDIKCSIYGREITGVNNIGKKYLLNSINKEEIIGTVFNTKTESCYFFEDTNSYLFLFKLRKKNYKYLKNYRQIEQKKFDIYMLSLVSLEEYNYMFSNGTNMELQSLCGSNQDRNLYTCFFIQ